LFSEFSFERPATAHAASDRREQKRQQDLPNTDGGAPRAAQLEAPHRKTTSTKHNEHDRTRTNAAGKSTNASFILPLITAGLTADCRSGASALSRRRMFGILLFLSDYRRDAERTLMRWPIDSSLERQ
jgi:hypothetical protein